MAETIFELVILSMMVACIAWTVTQEEIFAELHKHCVHRCKTASTMIGRKFFYVFTCEYCFSHWVTLAVLIITGFHLIFEDVRGSVIAFFVLPWLANFWMSIYRRVRVGIKYENALAEQVEEAEPRKSPS